MKNKQVFEHHNLCAKKELCGCKPPLQFCTMAVALKNATAIKKIISTFIYKKIT